MPETVDMLNALVLFTNFVLIPGVTYGSQLALGALGVTLIYAVLRFSNFAHGDVMAFGTMATILLTWWLQSMGVSFGPLPTRYYRSQKSRPVTFVMASLGVMFMVNGLVRFIIGPDDQRFFDGERFIIKAREFKTMTGLNEGLAIKTSQGLTVVIAIVLVLILFWFLQKTRSGKAMRAYSDNEDLSLLSGIDPDKVVRTTWIIAAALTAIAGVLYGLDKSFKPFTYFQLLLPIFAAAIVGGIGQPVGAIVGGYIIAFSEMIVTYPYKKFVNYLVPDEWAPTSLLQLLSTDYKFAVSFMILVIVLLVRPTGIFKGKVY